MKNSSKNHPTYIRLSARIGKLPCKKMIDWVKLHPSKSLYREGEIKISGYVILRKDKFTNFERMTRRAAKDKVYRKSLIKSLTPPKCRSIAAVEEYASGLQSRKDIKKALGSNTYAVCELPANADYLPVNEFAADKLGVKIVKRGKDWEVKPALRTYHFHSPGETTWRNGRAVSYSRATNYNYIRSIGLIKNPQTLIAEIYTTKIKVVLPENYHWNIDANGLHMVSGRDDYHVTASDLLKADPLVRIMEIFRALAAKRQESEVRMAAEAAENEGAYICLADSLRGGNCRAGSESFATRHGLNIRKHYSALELLQQANGDSGRVKLAISAAKYRHNREMQQGFSVLAEHTA